MAMVVEEVAEAVEIEADRSECLVNLFVIQCLSETFIMLFTWILKIFVLQVFNFIFVLNCCYFW